MWVVARSDPRPAVVLGSADRVQGTRNHVSVHVNQHEMPPLLSPQTPAIAAPAIRADAYVYRAAFGELADRRLGVGELVLAAVHLLEREPAGLDDPDRLDVRLGVDAERASDRESLVDQTVGHELHGLAALQAGEHDPPAVLDGLDRVADRLIGDRSQLEHDVGHRAVGDLGHARDHVLLVDVDRVVGAELARQRQLPLIARQPGDDDRAGAAGLGRDHRGQPALAGAEDQHGLAEPDLAQERGPADAGAERVEHHRDLGRDVRPHLVQDRPRMQVQVLAEAAPQARLPRQRRHPVRAVAVRARHVPPGQAVVAARGRAGGSRPPHDPPPKRPTARPHASRPPRSPRAARARGSAGTCPAGPDGPATARRPTHRSRTPRPAAARRRRRSAAAGTPGSRTPSARSGPRLEPSRRRHR